MKYERPEAEVVEFKTLEANAALGQRKSEMLTSTSVFQVEEGTMNRDTFN